MKRFLGLPGIRSSELTITILAGRHRVPNYHIELGVNPPHALLNICPKNGPLQFNEATADADFPAEPTPTALAEIHGRHQSAQRR